MADVHWNTVATAEGKSSAIILAGGKSSRMGQSKALLEFEGEPLIVHLVRRLRLLFPKLIVVAAPGQELPLLDAEIIRDDKPYQGPVGGIYYGLTAAGSEFSFVTSCDAPFLNSDLVAFLVSVLEDNDVVVPVWDDRLQPLHAVYRSNVTRNLAEQLEKQQLRPVFLYDKVKTFKVPESHIRRFDPEGLSFLNMNTPADYEHALELWTEQRFSADKHAGQITCTVELFGVARLTAKVKKLTIALPENATAADLILSLAEQVPVLVGKVIAADRRRLISGHACNINGRDFVRDPNARIRAGDSVFIISADAGG